MYSDCKMILSLPKRGLASQETVDGSERMRRVVIRRASCDVWRGEREGTDSRREYAFVDSRWSERATWLRLRRRGYPDDAFPNANTSKQKTESKLLPIVTSNRSDGRNLVERVEGRKARSLESEDKRQLNSQRWCCYLDAAPAQTNRTERRTPPRPTPSRQALVAPVPVENRPRPELARKTTVCWGRGIGTSGKRRGGWW